MPELPQIDLRSLLLFLLFTRPDLLRNIRQHVLLTLLLTSGLLGFGQGAAAGLGSGLGSPFGFGTL